MGNKPNQRLDDEERIMEEDCIAESRDTADRGAKKKRPLLRPVLSSLFAKKLNEEKEATGAGAFQEEAIIEERVKVAEEEAAMAAQEEKKQHVGKKPNVLLVEGKGKIQRELEEEYIEERQDTGKER